MRWRTELIQGMGKQGDQFIIILDINRVFTSADLALQEAAATTETTPVAA